MPRTLGPRFRLATRLGARFTGISNFASDAQFEVVVAGQSQGIFTNGQALSFSGFPGGGVPEFVLFPVGPAQPNTYPIQLTFDSPTAAFEAHPASPLRVLPLLRRLGPGSGISMDATNMLADGETAQLEAVVTGACTNTYQWRRDGVPLPGATNSTLAVSNFTRLQAGQYSVAVSNGSDVAESPPMRLAPLQYWLTITAPNGGVLRSPDLPLYDPGTAVTVTAVPAPGMAFSRWLGAITNPSNPLVVTMNSNVSLTAFFVPALAEPVALGGLKAEYFTNLAGGALADLTNSPFFPSSPDLVEVATQFESRTNWADSYGARLSGWLIPPTTGDYKFYLSSDDQGVLFLSTDASPEHKAPIAFEPAWSGYREYINSQNQATRSNPPVNISTNIPLVAGRAYYLESLVKEGVGGDHLSVSWQPPGGPAVTNGAAPIPGQYLASGTPYVGSFQPLRAASLTNSGQIGVSFGRLLDPESALQTTNYQVGGATVTGAALSPDRQGVLLNVSGLSGATFVLRAGAVRDLFGNSTPANTELTGAVLPQYRQDIGTPGDPAVAGTTFSSRAGEFDVVAGGSDIWNNADGFHFVYEQRTGDFDVQVRVESLEPVNRWSKAGLMVREALTAGSRHLTALVAPAGPTRDGQGGGAGLNAYEALFRPASGEATMTWNQPGADLSLPAYPQAWIRLQRTGNDFRAFRSADGWNWTLIGQTNQNYPATVHVGLATCSHNNNPGFTALARYRNYGDSGPAMPVILTQPTNVVVVLGAPAALSVTVSAPPPLGYQWWFRGAPVLGGTNAVLTFPSAQFADAGGYQVVATTTIGSVTSVVATLKVVHPIPGLFGTGVAEDGTLLSEGATDPHYRLVVSPDGSYPGPAAVVVNEAWPIAPAGPWLANGPASKWIAPRREQNTGNAQGAYTYRTTFALQDLNPFGARLTGQWAVDDGGVAVRLNGTATGLTNGSGFGSFVGFAITNGFVAGTNTLDFVVENGPSSPNPTGLRVELLGWVEANDIHVPLRFALRPGTGIGSLNLVLASTVGGLCRIETSTNLVNWMPWPTNLLFGAGETSVPLPTANAPSGFYRAAVYP